MARKKVTVVGAGNVGATTAQRIFDRGYADVVLVDIVEGLPQGKALDMLESGPVIGSDASIIGTNDYADTAGSDLTVITSGIARKPGMSRDDLLYTNRDIVGSVVQQVVDNSPDGIVITVTNPLDAMTQHALDVTGHAPRAPLRHGGHPGHRPVPQLPGGRAERLRPGRARLRPRRPRRYDGPPRRPNQHRRHPRLRAHPRRSAGGDRTAQPATAAARLSRCSRRAVPSTLPQPRLPRWSRPSSSTESR